MESHSSSSMPRSDATTVSPGHGTTHHAHRLQHETTGEKGFRIFRFWIAEAVIVAFTAVIAYAARYGNPKYDWINIPKKWQSAFEMWFQPLKEKGGVAELFAVASASTLVTSYGGNAFIPIMKAIQNRKERIVTAINEKWGKPGEVEAGKERVKHEEKETWWDVLLGRIVSWFIVSGTFFGIDLLAGKASGSDKRNFDIFMERIGRWVANHTKKGKAIIARIPAGQLVSEELEANRAFRGGKILVLDSVATAGAILVWNAIGRISARVRKEENERIHPPILHPHPSARAKSSDDESVNDITASKNRASSTHRTVSGHSPADFRTRYVIRAEKNEHKIIAVLQ